ncbi:hypothetical protein BDV93DRAFT_566147 [Ceratobasidium sp. AG-I]|nr:hypothetical protein BDV93DRAFT_566147 [Ceratobasidium sp. AG-I]
MSVERLGLNQGDPEKDGCRAGRVRSFFTLPAHLKYLYTGQLAYVELFEPFESPTSRVNRMHSTKPDVDSRNRRRTLVIPVSDIVMACHLAPKFHLLGREIKLNIHSDLLSVGKEFWLNHYYNHYFYQLMEHWQRRRAHLPQGLARHVRWDA